MDKPIMLDNPNFECLKKLCQLYIDELDDVGYADDDTKHYIFEEAMMAFFGKDVWKYINEKTE